MPGMVQGKFFGSAHLVAPLQHEQLRHFLAVEVAMHGVVGGGAERAEHQQHFVLLDQLAGLLDRLRRRVGVVEGDELDLAAVDAAFGVDLLEIGFLRLADDAEAGDRAAVGQGLADADFVLAAAAAAIPPNANAIVNACRDSLIVSLPVCFCCLIRRAKRAPASKSAPASANSAFMRSTSSATGGASAIWPMPWPEPQMSRQAFTSCCRRSQNSSSTCRRPAGFADRGRRPRSTVRDNCRARR